MPRVAEQTSCENPKVSVKMITYNHGKFIAQAIESVLMQETDFPVELVIGEDDSTDDTRRICADYARKYPGCIRLFLRNRSDPERQKYQFPWVYNTVEAFKACRGEYIALLEGDDYWTDPEKLKIQVGVLEKNPEAVLCSHRYQVIDCDDNAPTDDGLESTFQGKPQLAVTYQNYSNPWVVKTLTVVFRRSALQDFFQKHCAFDTLLFAHLLYHGGGGIALNRTMGVYRKHAGGICSTLEGRQRYEFGFQQMLMLVANEGFFTPRIEASYFQGCEKIAGYLVEDMANSHSASMAHMEKTLMLANRSRGFSFVDWFFYRATRMLCRAQVGCFRIHTAIYRIVYSRAFNRKGRAYRRTALCFYLAASAPILVVQSIHRFLRGKWEALGRRG